MPLAKILVVHNSYQQPGGEDAVFAAEAALLREHGHEVVECRDDNRRISGMSPPTLAVQTVWSRPSRRRLSQFIRDHRPDLAHFHNTFPLLSPATYSACREAGVPVVQTLHNYRLLCPAANFFREHHVCEDCLGKTPPWPGVRRGCYRGSRPQTAVVAAMLTLHRWLKTWQEQVNLYITPTEFARQKFIAGGLPSEKIVVKPNFVNSDLGLRPGDGHYALFVGRLSHEKGVRTILRAWQGLKGIPLNVAGDGPLLGEAQGFVAAEEMEWVKVLGQRAPGEVLMLMKDARFLVFASECYETFGRVAVEAFACGVPVIATRLGAAAEVIEEGRTGLLFQPGDSADLADKVRWAMDHPDAMRQMGLQARHTYEQKYTAEKNYEILSNIYERAAEQAKQSRQSHDATGL